MKVLIVKHKLRNDIWKYIVLFIMIMVNSDDVNGQNALKNNGIITVTNNVLRATVISTSSLVSLAACTVSCISVLSCAYIGVDTMAKTCTLLAATVGGPYKAFSNFAAVYIVESREMQYPFTIQQQQPCLSKPCQNGATCQSSGTPPTLNCTCPSGYTGPLCATAVTTTLYGMPDDDMDVYVNGLQVIQSCAILNLCTATVNMATSSLIAVRVNNIGGIGGFIMSLGAGGCATTMLWRCTTIIYAKWMDLDFDDSTWPLGSATGITNGANPYYQTPTISSSCPSISVGLGNTYCRLWLN